MWSILYLVRVRCMHNSRILEISKKSEAKMEDIIQRIIRVIVSRESANIVRNQLKKKRECVNESELICEYNRYFIVFVLNSIWSTVALIIAIFTLGDILVIGLLMFFVGLFYVAMYAFKMYYVVFNERITYRSWIGVTKKYEYADISYASIENDILYLYMSNNEQLKLPYGRYPEMHYILFVKNNVFLKAASIHEEFTIQTTREYKKVFKFMYGSFLVFWGALIIASSIQQVVGAIVVFLIFFIASAIELLDKLNKKMVVKGKEIVIYNFLGKTKAIALTEVSRVKRVEKNQTEYIYLYSQNRKIYSYSKVNENADLFEQFIKCYKWELF